MKEFLRDQFLKLADRLANKDFGIGPITFYPPASAETIEEFEQRTGHKILPSLRWALMEVSEQVDFNWHVPIDKTLPTPFAGIYSGGFHWSLELTRSAEEGRFGWIDSMYSDPNDPDHAVWRDKFVFTMVGNGDHLAIDLRPESHEQIVYLDHELSGGHGVVLARNLRDLIERWLPLAFVGQEYWQWLPFRTCPPFLYQLLSDYHLPSTCDLT